MRTLGLSLEILRRLNGFTPRPENPQNLHTNPDPGDLDGLLTNRSPANGNKQYNVQAFLCASQTAGANEGSTNLKPLYSYLASTVAQRRVWIRTRSWGRGP